MSRRPSLLLRSQAITLAIATSAIAVAATAGASLALAGASGAATSPASASVHAGRRPADGHAAVAGRLPRMTIARLHYEGGGDWYANPSSLPNLLAALGQRTTLPMEREPAEVRLTDDKLWDYPVLHATGHGEMRLSDVEVARLRDYLTRGGFLHVDDNYGLDPSFRREIARVFPDRPLTDVPLSHPIYHLVYEMPQGLPKIHEHDGKAPRGLGIFIGDRLAVFYSYESDLGNGWEDVGTYDDPPPLHEAALRMGVNLFVYAVTSRPVS
ncbi:MAG: DUF4159 domain-containing protein [Gemmatimonadaceae bacterium]